MSLNFPSNPSNGDTITLDNRTYRWDGYAWKLVNFDLPIATSNSLGAVKVGGGLVVENSGTLKDIGSMLYLWANFR